MKKIYLSFLLLAMCFNVNAQKRNASDAYRVAMDFVKSKENKTLKIVEATPTDLSQRNQQDRSAQANRARSVANSYYYIFNVGEDQGFVIVSGDERVETILGFADSGHLDTANMPQNMKSWLNDISSQMDKLPQDRRQAQRSYASTRFTDINPMIDTQWNQDYPYNSQLPQMAPEGLGYGNYLYYVGCVPTAMAQVMNYYKYPDVGVGHSTKILYYKFEPNGWYWWNTEKQPGYDHEVVFDADFGNTHYDWANMKSTYHDHDDANSPEVLAVATLMKHCSIASNTQFGTEWDGGSLTSYYDALLALIHTFKYASSAQPIDKSSYTNAQWESMLHAELTAGRPVICYGSNTEKQVGHAFVCDGYKFDKYNGSFFHYNWGWGGYGDGYFKSTALIIDEDDHFDSDEGAIIGIQPIVDVTNITLSESSVLLPVGSEKQLTATLLPSEASGMKVVWTSSNENVAGVNSDGFIIARAVGKTIVTASTVDGAVQKASCSVEVIEPTKPVEVLLLNATNLKMSVHETAILTGTIQPEDASNKTLEWSSNNELIAKVDKSGKVTACRIGKAIISAKSCDGSNIIAKCSVEVHEPDMARGTSYEEYDPTDDIGKKDKPTISESGARLMVIELRNGKTVVYALSEEPKMTFIGKEFTIKTSDYTIGYNSRDILRYTFKSCPVIDGVANTELNSYKVEDGKLLLSDFPAKQTVEVYNLSGVLIIKGQTDEQGALSLSLPQGQIVIIKCNGTTTKLMVK